MSGQVIRNAVAIEITAQPGRLPRGSRLRNTRSAITSVNALPASSCIIRASFADSARSLDVSMCRDDSASAAANFTARSAIGSIYEVYPQKAIVRECDRPSAFNRSAKSSGEKLNRRDAENAEKISATPLISWLNPQTIPKMHAAERLRAFSACSASLRFNQEFIERRPIFCRTSSTATLKARDAVGNYDGIVPMT